MPDCSTFERRVRSGILAGGDTTEIQSTAVFVGRESGGNIRSAIRSFVQATASGQPNEISRFYRRRRGRHKRP